ncbi:cytochrome d ubiquinol oxidase subunit II [Alistipes sp.]|uniref:cytochrome d ubiquinol oxidase subunit II n=1 Tax=Alistipes sp. TaxID=1872444 RepID=UPI000E95A9E6|nr:cytochrome d ubiquinol oxidase subunit II [Alistipes sp.]HBX90646.1 cytochrome C oxidase assembly protein [Alistipes sp.]HCN13596.1 cytochrome C oxidase assembly protein [Alistipes sp.]
MDTLSLLQHYWWFIVALLGALLVFLLFVQGGQALLYDLGRTDEERNLVVNSLGRKWELTFTTLVTFGGAFFASFPLFYSTSFGGACYVWLAILLCFVVQAVAYEYRRKPANVLGEKTFNAFLVANGVLGPLLLGTAVSTLFTGAPFTVDRLNLAAGAADGAAVISQWATPWHGLDAVASLHNVALGLAVALLAMALACQYFLNDIADATLAERARRRMIPLAAGFLALFAGWLVRLLTIDGYTADAAGTIRVEHFKYWHNLVQMPAVAVLLLAGVASVAWSFRRGSRGRRDAVWFGGGGTVATVLALLLLAGWNDTAYYPSLADMQSSLTIRNSSSSLFTLRTMAWVSLAVPFVAAYIAWVWRAMNRRPLTRDELREGGHQY